MDRHVSILFPLELRQETDGPQDEQLEFVPCGQIVQDEHNSRIIGEAEPCPEKRQRPHIPHSRGQGDLPDCGFAEGLLRGQKGR